MTFEEYIETICDSVAQTGYDEFFPSLCVSSEAEDQFAVLETDLTEDGEREVARNWAESFVSEGQTTFLAFRSGDRMVAVQKIVGFDAVLQTNIHVAPYVES